MEGCKLMKVLVTGTAGFIGNALALRLLDRGDEVIGVDNVNDYYDVRLKEARLERIKHHPNFTEIRAGIHDRQAMEEVFAKYKPQRVVNLAAQAGVRYSLQNPHAYVDSNLVGFVNILEGCRHHDVEHLVYASSSSVYGANTKMPFSVHDNVDHPVSLYAATKKANELMAHSYSHLYGMPTTGLRFFTVYGPWGRPDMAYFTFAKAIVEGRAIDVYNYGDMRRDFTYIDDIVDGVARVLDSIPQRDFARGGDESGREAGRAPYKIYNIGNHQPVPLMRMVEVLEVNLGKVAKKNFLPMQAGDVCATYADVDDLKMDVDFMPATAIEVGIEKFVAWYREFYSVPR